MRKIYKLAGLACLGLLLSVQNSDAQTVSDFEGQTLAPNSFWDGSDMSGVHNAGIFKSTIVDGTTILPNTYDTAFGAAWGSWSQGFAYSNMTDSTTSGFGNQHSARTAVGVNGSTNYGLANQDDFNGIYPTIHLTGGASGAVVSGLYVTNTTYAANSMRDGDFAGKIFGDSLDANGANDGTNGDDWFLLTVKGYTGGVLTTDSVNFYLADYRFPNNAQDYIVTDWNWVNLTSLGSIDSLVFVLTSSDVGSFGINTPTYFAFDNLNDQTVSINNISDNLDFSIYPNPAQNQLNLNLDIDANSVELVNITGQIIMNKSNLIKGLHKLDLSGVTPGVYFIRVVSNTSIKVERFIKH